jgi:hypothetical protein
MFRLDYLSCFLTVVATILVGRKMWTGLVVSGVNSLIVCVIGLHTSQYGFIPANVFCICINAFNLRTWLKAQKDLAESTTDASSERPGDKRPGDRQNVTVTEENASASSLVGKAMLRRSCPYRQVEYRCEPNSSANPAPTWRSRAPSWKLRGSPSFRAALHPRRLTLVSKS